MPMSGSLIAVEGIDGAGKTTQARRLVDWLSEKGFKARYTAEPTRGAVGRILRAMAFERDVDHRVEAVLFAADRMIHLKRVILPLLEKGFIVVSDRYLHSSLAYQSVTTGDQSWVEELNKYSRRPDVAILLDVDPAVGLERLKKRRKTRFERIEFLRRVREKYLEYVDRGELLRIDAGRDSEIVFSEIAKAVETALEKKKL